MDRNERKLALHKQISDFKKEFKEKSADYKILGKDILLIGGIIVTAYSFMKMFDDHELEDEDDTEETIGTSIISSTVKGAATSVLLALAKVKLSEYLESINLDEDVD